MENPVITQLLETLKQDFKTYKDALQEVSEDIIKQGFSQYPIFVAHQEDVAIGEVILDRNELGTNWTIQASTLEEFIEKGIIEENRAEFFRNSFKSPGTTCCMFMVSQYGARFVFVPFNTPGQKHDQ